MDIIALRREFHMHPEVGFTEFRTASKIVELLNSLGYHLIYGRDAMDGDFMRGVPSNAVLEMAYQRALLDGANPNILQKMKGGYTTVIGVLKGIKPGPTVAFRFDMDALPIAESQDENHYPKVNGFRSKYEGNMHACGHDGHTAIGLGLAEKLADGQFAGTIKLIFQAAEEGVRGAYAIVQKGLLDDVDYMFCHHLGADVPTGEFHGGSTHFLSSTKMIAHYYGVAAHAGGNPEMGRNALLGASTALLNIHAIPRFSTGPTRVNVGILEGGTATNIIPQYAKMNIETRALTEEENKDLEERVRNIITHSASMHELDHQIEVIGAAIPITCDNELVELTIEEAKQAEGFTSFGNGEGKGLGSEDASFMIKRVQDLGGKGTYMIVGSTIPAPHHNPKFDIEEEILPHAVELFNRIARRILK
ncbi:MULTISPECIES: amidohydrolase [Cytobacillus]|uniref:Aminobenzoyl-glutamate utilization protein A n=1 Tax=Cytobacillus oceanisediminis 2691 TaxID=1196031 RepID=A0A160M8Z6_9BACI|nr:MULTISPECIES: amidohydrolase [Cytobacillus]AND39136.1 aminobenzoyl-glutamate utilization protein A [Cytobacillus oceanisediminis 2691]MBY0157663.1 amidohydrolase [Cytobacillus firmus]MCM3395988.1 amidohydrolase [Cytobacillus oceanisediminis]UQX56442.1 amidohydrolase [Cytobacillus pseudoceanisediminis]